jgi:hypothetical protein
VTWLLEGAPLFIYLRITELSCSPCLVLLGMRAPYMIWYDCPKCAPDALVDSSLWWSAQVVPSTLHQIVRPLTCVARQLGWSHPLARRTPKEPQLSPI